MRFWTITAVALLAIESAAIACSCIATDDPAELRKLAGEAAKDAIALVEVETMSAYDSTTAAGEVMKVTAVHGGTAPERFRIERGAFPSSASCDILYEPGQKTLVILYQSTAHGALPFFRTSGLCTAHLLERPVFRDELVRLMRGSARGQRG